MSRKPRRRRWSLLNVCPVAARARARQPEPTWPRPASHLPPRQSDKRHPLRRARCAAALRSSSPSPTPGHRPTRLRPCAASMRSTRADAGGSPRRSRSTRHRVSSRSCRTSRWLSTIWSTPAIRERARRPRPAELNTSVFTIGVHDRWTRPHEPCRAPTRPTAARMRVGSRPAQHCCKRPVSALPRCPASYLGRAAF